MKCLSRGAFLGGATLFGVLVAYWTRTDQLPSRVHWLWIYGIFAHITVLFVWTAAWIFYWRDCLRQRGGRLFGWTIPLAAAAVAELVQKYIPGHFPDWLGFFYNLVGAGLGPLLTTRRSRAPEPRGQTCKTRP